MRLGRQSGNVEDRRGMGVPLAAGGGIGAIVLVLLAYFLGVNPSDLPQQPAPGQASQPYSAPGATADDPGKKFVSEVLADTEDTWHQVFKEQLGREYRDPKLVLFSGAVESECGMGQTASGPFYCPLDEQVYIDLEFYRELRDRFGAPGDFAQAYVISHEVGHHVQKLLGISDQVHSAQERAGRRGANQLSVALELQADCFAGVWGNHAKSRNILDPGDLEEALNAAAAIGDDAIQKQTTGRVRPESWTHGSSQERVQWFKRGFNSGDMRQCDTFTAAGL
ncbi:MAG: neutral zinc metallopeptidase [Acidobacteriota bacterium]